MTRTRDHWTDDAVCRGVDVNVFRDDQPRLAAAAAIRRFCHHCPVTRQCAAAARATNSVGVWGGLLFTRWPTRRARTATELDGKPRPTAMNGPTP